MAVEVPYATKPEDVNKLLLLLPSTVIPKGKIDANYFKSLGFSLSSGNYLLALMRHLGFLDENDKPSASWIAYRADEKRGLVLALGIKKAYGDLFSAVLVRIWRTMRSFWII